MTLRRLSDRFIDDRTVGTHGGLEVRWGLVIEEDVQQNWGGTSWGREGDNSFFSKLWTVSSGDSGLRSRHRP